MDSTRQWYRDNFMVSSAQNLLQPSVINTAFGSDAMYWTRSMPEESLKKLLSKSLCLGVYVLPLSSFEISGRRNPTQIGLARVITDEVTFVYLTDVYIDKEYQGKGLGTWLMECLNEMIEGMPDLRRAMLLTGSKKSKEFYGKVLGMTPFPQDSEGLEVLNRKGPGSPLST